MTETGKGDDTPMHNTETVPAIVTDPAPSSNNKTKNKNNKEKMSKSAEFTSRTIRSPPFAYAHLQLVTNSSPSPLELDAISVRKYCTAALRQFLGLAGTAISLDILKVQGSDCWLRVPRDDLAAFAAAVTAWQGTFEGDAQVMWRIRACSDWLGSLVGQMGEEELWRG
jgi:ribonuclease P/MRP protein subunit POP8